MTKQDHKISMTKEQYKKLEKIARDNGFDERTGFVSHFLIKVTQVPFYFMDDTMIKHLKDKHNFNNK